MTTMNRYGRSARCLGMIWLCYLAIFGVAHAADSDASTLGNIAPMATVTTSYVSPWETLAAVNDGHVPSDSGDHSHGAYGNWDNPNQFQWVTYEWDNPYELSSTRIYWFSDGGGVLVPSEAVLEYWQNNQWVNAGPVPLNANQFNTVELNNISTQKLRVRMSHATQSTGILEWEVLGQPHQDVSDTDENIAADAIASTSYVSPWESIAALNDGDTPDSSADHSHGAYGNWDTPNTEQWVVYEWSSAYTLSSSQVYWFSDEGGVLLPTEAELDYWGDNSWVRVGPIPREADRFNTLALGQISTRKLRIRMKNTTASTGILEWRVQGVLSDQTPTDPEVPDQDTALDPGHRNTDWASSAACAAVGADCVSGVWRAPEGGNDQGLPVRYESEHFAFYWKDGTRTDIATAQQAAETLESVWDHYFGSQIQFKPPYCDQEDKWKISISIDNDYPLWGGGWTRSGISYAGMWIGPDALNDQWGLAHEFTHGVQALTPGFPECGGSGCWIYESHANWMPHQIFRDNVHCSVMLANSAHLHYGNTRNRYCNWQFFEFLKDKHCPAVVNNMWSAPAQPGLGDPWQKLMVNQGWNMEQLNDEFGEWALHNVTWDYQNPDGSDQGQVYRQNYGPITDTASNFAQRRLRLTQLEALNDDWAQSRRFMSPYYWAPQRWGYNVIRLTPEQGADRVSVKFRGVTQDGAYSGWRWGLVATDANLNQPRYSRLHRGTRGDMNFVVNPGDQLFLVVLAAPSRYQKITWEQPMDGTPYPSIYRYPYMVELQGAWPEGFAGGVRADCPVGTQRHGNGGGCAPASTPDSVYVGPYAKVLGGTVSDQARIEDHATILDGEVSGQSTVGALTILGVTANRDHGAARFNVRDNASLLSTFYPMGWFSNGSSLSGSARYIGDLEVYAGNRASGTFYGLVDDNTQGVSEAEEVTVRPPYLWRE